MIKKHSLFILLSIAALIVRILVIKLPFSPWWDPSIYVGMSKFLFSGGMYGMWETLRPPMMALMIGTGWFAGFEPLLFAKILITIMALGTFAILYVLGEKEEQGFGLAAALILALSPIYTYFIAIPTSDIPATFFALLAAFFALRNRYQYAGFFIALSFLTRFPSGLFLVAFGFFILIQKWQGSFNRNYIHESIKKIFSLAIGFAIIAIPYLILNKIFFGDPLLPIKLGREVIEGNQPLSFWYYFTNTIVDNPLMILWLVGLVGYIVVCIKKHVRPAPLFTLSLLSIIVVGGYLSHIGHKELRYSFTFLPFMVVLAAYGVRMLWKWSDRSAIKYIVLALILIIGGTNMWYQTTRFGYAALSDARKAYYAYIPAPTKTITSSPQVMLYSNTKIVDVFDSWDEGSRMLKAHAHDAQYVAIDSCQVFGTDETAMKQKAQFLTELQVSGSLSYYAVDGSCELSIYQLR